MRDDEPVRGLRRAAGPAAWLASTVVATGIAWWAVTAVGARGEAQDSVLSESEVAAALAAERDALAATASAAPSAGTAEPTTEPTGPTGPTGPTTTGDPGDPTAAPVVRTWSLEGGAVSASCVGDAVSLEYATAASGWRVDAKERGPGPQVLVELEREGVEIYVRATCVDGTPEYQRLAGEPGSDGDEHAGTSDEDDDGAGEADDH